MPAGAAWGALDWGCGMHDEDVRFAVLGPVRAWRGDTELDLGQPQQRAVLAALLLRKGAHVTLDGLVDDVWGETAPATSTRLVRTYIYRLRLVLGRAGSGHIRSVGGGYVLEAGPRRCDLTRFGHLLSQGRAARTGGNPARAVGQYAEGLALWTGTALAGVPGPYADAQRTRLNELRLSAQEERLACAVALGRYDHAAAELAALVTEHPLREQLRELQMHALYGAGRQAEALSVLRETERLLRAELGVDPGPGLHAMHRRILNADPSLLPPVPAAPGAAAPLPAPARPPAAPAQAGAAASPMPVPAQLPHDLVHFTGRAGQLDELSALAGQAGRSMVVAAIGGTAGIGKTALVVHWAHRAAGNFPDGQLYVNLRGFDPTGTPVPAGTAIRGFLDALGVPAAQIPADHEAQTGLYRSLMAGRRMLVVLDNACDPEQVRPLLPGSAGSMVLVTSRSQLAGLVARDGAHSLTLDLLTPQEARDLLARRLGARRVAAEPASVGELIDLCARLPLALNITAANAAAQPAFSLAVFAAQLRQDHNRLAALDTGDVTSNARAVFSWSYRTLAPATARMFRFLGLHPGPYITVPAAASLAAVTREQARTALDELARACLLTESSPGRYTCHDLLRAYAAEQSGVHDSPAEQHRVARRTLDHYLHTAYPAARLLAPAREQLPLSPPGPGVLPETLADSQQAWYWFSTEHRVLLAALAQAETRGMAAEVCQLARPLGVFLEHRGQWHDYRAVRTSALAAARCLGDLAEQARVHRQLAHLSLLVRAYPNARSHLDLAIELYRCLDDPLGEANTRHGLALLLDRQGRYRAALDQARQALPLYRASGERRGQAGILNAIGCIHARLGNHRQALDSCRQTLELHHGLDTEDFEATSLDSLGHAHHHLGHHRQAIECYHRALDLFRRDRHVLHQADTLTRLGETHRAARDPESARDAWEQARLLFQDLQLPDAEQLRLKLLELRSSKPVRATARTTLPAHSL